MTEQLQLELDPRRVNPNAHLFDEHGQPRRLLWCSDAVRIRGAPCPYRGEYVRFRPPGGCCLDLAERPWLVHR